MEAPRRFEKHNTAEAQVTNFKFEPDWLPGELHKFHVSVRGQKYYIEANQHDIVSMETNQGDEAPPTISEKEREAILEYVRQHHKKMMSYHEDSSDSMATKRGGDYDHDDQLLE